MDDNTSGEVEVANVSEQPQAVMDDIQKGCFGSLLTLINLFWLFVGIIVLVLVSLN